MEKNMIFSIMFNTEKKKNTFHRKKSLKVIALIAIDS